MCDKAHCWVLSSCHSSVFREDPFECCPDYYRATLATDDLTGENCELVEVWTNHHVHFQCILRGNDCKIKLSKMGVCLQASTHSLVGQWVTYMGYYKQINFLCATEFGLDSKGTLTHIVLTLPHTGMKGCNWELMLTSDKRKQIILHSLNQIRLLASTIKHNPYIPLKRIECVLLISAKAVCRRTVLFKLLKIMLIYCTCDEMNTGVLQLSMDWVHVGTLMRDNFINF